MSTDVSKPTPWLWHPEREDRPREELRIPLYPEPPRPPEPKKDEPPKSDRGVMTWDI